ncbi:MAG TPA: ribbon-helix-helix protein, CopG family [Sphingobium sp.]|nr:ribbon-helix-helix protein, CopG family [Sphingobium sp.]
MRILADLSDDDVKWLDGRAAELGLSRAALLREAVTAFRATESTQGLERFLGLWARQGSAIDGLAYERLLRGASVDEGETGL